MTSAYSFDNSWDQAKARLTALQQRFDPGTTRCLEALGVAEGWRCLELGAGAGSIAAWLCEKVGKTGFVMATDLDIRLFADLQAPTLEVREQDVVREDLPVGAFDLVHARALLAHLPGRDDVLRKMTGALRPGGWLVCEDLDNMTTVLVAPEDPSAAALYLKVEAAIADAMGARGHAFDYGRRLPARFADAGLSEVRAEGRMLLRRSGPDAEIARLTAEQLGDGMVARGALTSAELEGYFELLESPDFLAQGAMMVAAWGRRPGGTFPSDR